MNILKYPDQADRGAVLSKREFEEMAIEASLVEDLMDRTDLEPNEFFREAIRAANCRRTAQNPNLWIATPEYESAFLVNASLVQPLQRMHALYRAQKKQTEVMARTIREFIDAGGKP